jgi:hypothetical protein
VIAARLATLALVLVALGLAGCSDSNRVPENAVGVGVPGLISMPRIEVFTCADWNDADIQTKMAAVGRIRDFVGGQVTGAGAAGSGTVLDDNRAYDFFEQTCDPELAAHFLLYKLYGRAAGFAGQAP